MELSIEHHEIRRSIHKNRHVEISIFSLTALTSISEIPAYAVATEFRRWSRCSVNALGFIETSLPIGPFHQNGGRSCQGAPE
ncbi:hypothetical protein KIN20_028038 [Parelaphostrongylus tenuis]|uniref:Uncharacterized protein n=1 Tax=Parelaphostrongylus tenuis TaxID=148309 RepID=A0AAD5WEF5_PARTN|nr:hypothetical protein KIN20_028038 [Parelaphostrongylus tenuis]